MHTLLKTMLPPLAFSLLVLVISLAVPKSVSAAEDVAPEVASSNTVVVGSGGSDSATYYDDDDDC